jgi:hypothetical protein
MARKTESQRLAEKNSKAIANMKKGSEETAELQERVRRGELTAGEALRLKAGEKPSSFKLEQEMRKEILAQLEWHRGEVTEEQLIAYHKGCEWASGKLLAILREKGILS